MGVLVERALAGDQRQDRVAAGLEVDEGAGIVERDGAGLRHDVEVVHGGALVADQDGVPHLRVAQAPADPGALVAVEVREVDVPVEQDVPGLPGRGAQLPPADRLGVVGRAEAVGGGGPHAHDARAQARARHQQLPLRAPVQAGAAHDAGPGQDRALRPFAAVDEVGLVELGRLHHGEGVHLFGAHRGGRGGLRPGAGRGRNGGLRVAGCRLAGAGGRVGRLIRGVAGLGLVRLVRLDGRGGVVRRR